MEEGWGQNLDFFFFFISLGLWSGPWLELGYLEAAPVPQSLILGW